MNTQTKKLRPHTLSEFVADLMPLWKLFAALGVSVLLLFIVNALLSRSPSDVATPPKPSDTAVAPPTTEQIQGMLVQAIKQASPQLASSAPAMRAMTTRDVAKSWTIYQDVTGYAFDRARYPEVLGKLTDAMNADPFNVEVINLLARVHADRLNVEDAKVYFKRALDINPGHQGALLGLTTILLNEHKPDDARPYVLQLQKLYPRDAEVEKRAKRLEAETKRPQKAH